jgi:hypothetical protein
MATQPNCSRLFLFLAFFALPCLPALSQSKVFEEKVFINDSLNTIVPREKLFIHYDKPYYKPGDTIWLKGYILTAPEHIPNDSSRLAYIEIINAQNEPLKRISTPCIMGLFAGNITLYQKDFPQGEYLLRAYTRYLQNFGDSLFFESRFTIIDPGAEAWKTTVRQLSFAANRLVVSASLAGESRELIANRTVSVRLRAKNKTLFRARALTDPSGNIYIDTLLKEADTKNLQLEIAEQGHLKLQLPVKTGENRLIDLQFLPEGGTFIAGKLQRLGFKALDASGKGIDVKGVIKDSKGAEVAGFASIHKGMGIVSFTPGAGEAYTAVLENGLSFTLPVPEASGILLQVIDQPKADSIRLRIAGSPDRYGNTVYFTATTRGITAARGKVIITAKDAELSLARKQFRSGITVFTLYDRSLQPLNSRAVFIRPPDDLQLALTPHKSIYGKKDSVSLTLKLRDGKGENAAGVFSMAVLDTSQVRVLTDAENLVSYMLLSSDLKGTVEEPYYYFKNPGPDAAEALLLTQGWISYERKAGPAAFEYEKGFVISGRVSNLFNKSIDGSKVVLFGKAGKNTAFFLDTLTNEDGVFTFNRFDFYETDSISMLIKALNKNGKAFNVGIDLNAPVYPEVNASTKLYGMGDILVDTMVQQYVAKQEKVMTDLKKDGVLLQEVVVVSRLRVQGSKNLNENGGADQVINEEALNKMPKESLLNILKTQVPGFRMGTPPKSKVLLYMINANVARFVIDGIDLHFFYQSSNEQRNEYVQFLDTYLSYFNAEDIAGIEIMNSLAYTAAYRARQLNTDEQISNTEYSFIEITTHSGQGPFMRKTPGMYLLRPLYPALGKQFYSPRYTSPGQETVFPDLRNTIYWNPDIITNENGEATVSFYTSESKSSGYLIIVQGTDLKGNLVVLYQPMATGGK